MRFEVYGASGKARWRVKAGNGQTVASSGEAFASRANAERAAQSFKKGVAKADFEVYADRGGKHRWRAKAANGQTVASSDEAFSTRSNAQRAARNVQAKAAGATDASA